MRNANAQRGNSMVRVSVLQQPPGPHVSHAEIGGWQCPESEVRRIALCERTMEKKTKIPACFSSERLFKGHSEGEETF
jgi:hypothetical protein